VSVVGDEDDDSTALGCSLLDRLKRADAGQSVDESELAALSEVVIGAIDDDPDDALVRIEESLLD
jgi:hypothetical protein